MIMAMTKKHFDAIADEAGIILSEIKSKDLMLAVIARAEIADLVTRLVGKAAATDPDSRYSAEKFEQAMWAAAANHS